MVKKVLVETERSFKILNLCIGNNEIHMLNEREIFAILKRPGKIRMYELSQDEQQRVLITKDNYNIATKFVNDNPVKVENVKPVEQPKVHSYVEKVITPIIKEEKPAKKESAKKVEEPKKVVEPKKVEEAKKVEEPKKEEPKKEAPAKVEEPKKVEETKKAEEPKKEEVKKEAPAKAEITNEEKELEELAKEIEKMEAEEKENK